MFAVLNMADIAILILGGLVGWFLRKWMYK